jgi:hypothetical protein
MLNGGWEHTGIQKKSDSCGGHQGIRKMPWFALFALVGVCSSSAALSPIESSPD